jgi:hypothetical protein
VKKGKTRTEGEERKMRREDQWENEGRESGKMKQFNVEMENEGRGGGKMKASQCRNGK